MNKIMPNIYLSPNCICGGGRHTIKHYMLECSEHTEQRASMYECIDIGYVVTDTKPSDRLININTLLGSNSHLCQEMRGIINSLVEKFIRQTNIDI